MASNILRIAKPRLLSSDQGQREGSVTPCVSVSASITARVSCTAFIVIFISPSNDSPVLILPLKEGGVIDRVHRLSKLVLNGIGVPIPTETHLPNTVSSPCNGERCAGTWDLRGGKKVVADYRALHIQSEFERIGARICRIGDVYTTLDAAQSSHQIPYPSARY